MANGFYKTIKKIGEFFGLGKIVKGLNGMSDDEYKQVSDYIDNNDDATIDKLIATNPTGRTVLKTKDIIKPIFDPIIDAGNWAKEQIEASTGSAANETNKEIAETNLDFEREKFDYDKALQQQIFQREDTANQRTVNDMRMAGLNPLNMQGTNGAGNVVATSAPHNDFQMQSTQGLQIMDQIFNTALSAKATASNNSLQQANANLLNAQADNQRIKNMYEADILSASLEGTYKDNMSKQLDLIDSQKNYLFNSFMGWTKEMPDWLKQSSARMNYTPFAMKFTRSDFDDLFLKSHNQTFGLNNENLNGILFDKSDISQQLLSDELLQGTLGIFGNVLKLLYK